MRLLETPSHKRTTARHEHVRQMDRSGMNEDDLRTRFPRASASFLRANLSAGGGIPNTEPRQREAELAGDCQGEAQGPGLLHCRFTLVRKKLLDVDAKYSSVKDLLDCLVIAGIARGDKEGQITLEVVQRKTAKGQAEFTEITVFRL